MNLIETPEFFVWPPMHYAFIEKTGPFMQTAPQAWKELHQAVGEIGKNNTITGFVSLYKIGPKTYRAGVALAGEAKNLPAGVVYEHFMGGKYAKYVLTGSYSQLPEACGRVMQMVADSKLLVRDDFYIENYPNDPKTTPEEKLITEILIPSL
jgi:DNA gyrase inhibitor GyrI